MTYKVSTAGLSETHALGRKIGALLKGGEVIELVGDIGSGKTSLTQGIASGLGYTGDVPSPTFTLSRTYELKGGKQFHHFDLYRLEGFDIATAGLQEVMDNKDDITVIEWPGHGEAELPQNRLIVDIELGPDDSREFRISGPKELSYILENLK